MNRVIPADNGHFGPAPGLEIWFDFGSNYSYLSVLRIEEAARATGVNVEWRPFLLGPVFRDLGWSTSPLLAHDAKARYVWRDMERQAARHNLPWTRPSRFPRSSVLPARVALIGADQWWAGDFCRRVMRQNFVEDRDIDSPEPVSEALEGLGLDSARILAEANSADVKARLQARTEEAQRRGVFGAPTFFCGPEMFWGNDRLDEAMEWAAAST
ncbi:2-hydroxychromene-2-carboxylate isomerase [Ectothiorhodospiraceae bacterium WFHF3C12]|nr:2-hydroxychromene-2-carboxylate isomerase [Ectothiorhodospiraceae bacterium WFHF3C12]